MTRRLHYIDWLRVLAVLLLFPYHTSRVFNYGEPFYVKAPQLSIALGYTLGFISMWHMQLLFLLAGASAYFSLKRRSGGQFARERVKRLFVPLVFGILVLIPPQTWIGAQFNSGYAGSYVEYITSGRFLVLNFGPGGDYYGGFGIGQLWFILFLMTFSMVVLPLFLWGRGDRGARTVQRFARLLSKPAGWLLAAFIILLAEAAPELVDKNIVYYLVFFVLGFVIMSDDSFMESADRYRWPALIVGVIGCAVWVGTGPWRDSLPDPSFPLFGVVLAGMLSTWLTLIGLLGTGRHYLDHPTRALPYLAESSYPVYILHQTVIVVAAFYLLQVLPASLPLQWVVILVVAVAGTFALYEIVRRVGVLRFLFGMRPKPKAAAADSG